MKKKEIRVPADKIIEKIAALGVPALVFIIAISATGLSGAAAITAALAALGPGGMIGGVAFLGVSVLIIDAISKFGFDYTFSSVVKELYKRGESKESILEKIEKYHISKELKRKLIDKVNSYENSHNNEDKTQNADN